MARAVGAAIVGYVVMVFIVFGGLTGLWNVLGADGAFEAGSWQTSTTWNFTNPIVGIIAGIAGGYFCALISPGRRALGVLIGIVLVMGLLSAAASMAQPEPAGVRPESVTMFDAMGNARAPLWAILINPVVGVIGSLIGARLRGRPSA